MRIISQDGKHDIPYEYFSISVISGYFNHEDEISICATNSYGNTKELAHYSSIEKAQKAMDMLHETYSNSLLIKTFDSLYLNIKDDKTYLEELRHITPWVVKSYAPERKPMEIEMVPIFRFPQDDEIEV